jgi:hypothetical protein
VETYNGTRYRSKKVLLSVPSNVYSQICFSPALPPPKEQLSKQSIMGHYSKTVYIFSSPGWYFAGLSGAITSEEGPITYSRDTCVPELGQLALPAFTSETPAESCLSSLSWTGERFFGTNSKLFSKLSSTQSPNPLTSLRRSGRRSHGLEAIPFQ